MSVGYAMVNPHDLFNCPHNPTPLTVTDLRMKPKDVSVFLGLDID